MFKSENMYLIHALLHPVVFDTRHGQGERSQVFVGTVVGVGDQEGLISFSQALKVGNFA
jgi:hypothetical protein